jgi:hypothetical protein
MHFYKSLNDMIILNIEKEMKRPRQKAVFDTQGYDCISITYKI